MFEIVGLWASGLSRHSFKVKIVGSNPISPAKICGVVAERMRHLIVDQDYASSNLVDPASFFELCSCNVEAPD